MRWVCLMHVVSEGLKVRGRGRQCAPHLCWHIQLGSIFYFNADESAKPSFTQIWAGEGYHEFSGAFKTTGNSEKYEVKSWHRWSSGRKFWPLEKGLSSRVGWPFKIVFFPSRSLFVSEYWVVLNTLKSEISEFAVVLKAALMLRGNQNPSVVTSECIRSHDTSISSSIPLTGMSTEPALQSNGLGSRSQSALPSVGEQSSLVWDT